MGRKSKKSGVDRCYAEQSVYSLRFGSTAKYLKKGRKQRRFKKVLPQSSNA